MSVLTRLQSRKVLYLLIFFHILIITLSNYLVQLPFVLLGFNTTWGAFTFPFIFLITDLTIRLFGASFARIIIFVVMFPALTLSYFVSALFSYGHWLDFSVLLEGNIFVARIALASFFAYLAGQLIDVTVFNALRKKTHWWTAPSLSAVIGNMVDTAVFFSVAFYRSNQAFMASHWIEIAIVDYTFKIFIYGLFFLPLYGVMINVLLKKLTGTKTEKA